MTSRCRVLGNQVAEAFNYYGNSSNYNYIWFLWTILEYIHRENVKLTAMKNHKNACGELECLHGSFEGALHLFVIVYVSETQDHLNSQQIQVS